MPRRDGTGPMGLGSMTGRGLGPCGTGNFKRFAGAGLGLGLGLGCRWGFRRFAQNNPNFMNAENAETQKDMLMEQKNLLEERLGFLKEQIKNLGDDN